MSERSTEDLVAELAGRAVAARPLPPPWRRALTVLAAIVLASALGIAFLSDPGALEARYSGSEDMMMLEMTATFATGALALTAAFFLAIPGRSRKWLLAPIPPLVLWLSVSGIGCYRDLLRRETLGLEAGHSGDCLLFIIGASLVLGVPVLWLLARARPIDPVPVAVTAGLGVAALAALLLQFFHPFAVTFLDLAVHVLAVLLVVGVATLLNRRTLAPA
jgi:hypothetical protein